MTDRSLADLGWLDVREVAWWFGLLYRRPKQFEEGLQCLPKVTMLRVGAVLVIHALFYSMIILALCRLLQFAWLNLSLRESFIEGAAETFVAHIRHLAFGVAVGIVIGTIFGMSGATVSVFVRGVAAGITLKIAIVSSIGIAIGIVTWMTLGDTFEIATGIAAGITFGIALGGTIGIFSGVLFGAHPTNMTVISGIFASTTSAFAIGMISDTSFAWVSACAMGAAAGTFYWVTRLRAYYYLWHIFLQFSKPTAAGYHLHPITWDDLCSLNFTGLNRFLLAYREADATKGDAEIERLITDYPSQRMEALKARSAVIAREATAHKLGEIDAITNGLPEGEKGFLKQTPQVRDMVADIAEAKRRLDTIDRPFLREPYAETLVSKIESFRGQVSGFREPLASEFRSAADAWLTRAQAELDQVTKVTEREPTPQVFRAGDPVDRSQEAFVPRLGVIGQVERQLTLASGCPGLLIYGRRRMGKSTLIRNLDAFVPDSVRIVTISMQDPAAFTSLSHFVRLVSRRIKTEFGEGNELTKDDLDGLSQHLSQVNEVIAGQDRRLVLALDEFENIDQKIGEGVFPLDLLATLREIHTEPPSPDLGLCWFAPHHRAHQRRMAVLSGQRSDHRDPALQSRRDTASFDGSS